MQELPAELSALHMNSQIEDLELKNVPEATATPFGPSLPECRICLESESPDDNQLLTPCSCTGSVQYIHTNCFKTWIDKKCEDPKIKKQIYSGEGVKCELCK